MANVIHMSDVAPGPFVLRHSWPSLKLRHLKTTQSILNLFQK